MSAYRMGPVDYTNEVGTWYVTDPEPPGIRCRMGLHSPERLRADGYVNYFTHVKRLRCQCGRKEWVWFDGGIVGGATDVDPDLDQRVRETHERMAAWAERRQRSAR